MEQELDQGQEKGWGIAVKKEKHRVRFDRPADEPREQVLTAAHAFVGQAMEHVQDVAIVVRGGEIVSIEEQRHVPTETAGIALLPRFVNAHVHLGDSAFKEGGLSLSLKELVAPPSGLKHRLLESTPRSVLVSAMELSIQEAIEGGIVSFLDFREGGVAGYDLIAAALQEYRSGEPLKTGSYWRRNISSGDSKFPFLMDFFPRVLVRPGLKTGEMDDSWKRVLSLPDVAGINISSPNRLDDEQMAWLATLTVESGCIFSTHVGETTENPWKSISLHGKTDLARVLDFFSELENRLVLVHCNFVAREDVSLVAERGASVVFCPRTAMYFANVKWDGLPWMDFSAEGANCCLGTDNVMVNNLDMFQEMQQFIRVCRATGGPASIDPREVLKMATINGAKALSLDDRIGSIEPGKNAALMAVDVSRVPFTPSRNILATIIMRGCRCHVHAPVARRAL